MNPALKDTDQLQRSCYLLHCDGMDYQRIARRNGIGIGEVISLVNTYEYTETDDE